MFDEITMRIPVYYGEPMRELYDNKKLKSVFNYTTQQALGVKREHIFCIGGRAALIDQSKYVTIIHGWGVNLEKDKTADYRRFTHRRKLKVDDFRREITRRMMLWVGTAHILAEGKDVILRIPLIGMGTYLNALKSDAEKAVARMIFADAVIATASAFRDVYVHVCDYDYSLEGDGEGKLDDAEGVIYR